MGAVVGERIADQDAASSIVAGRIDRLDAGTPAATVELVNQAHGAFTAGVSMVLLVAGTIVFLSAVAAFLFIREKDAVGPPKGPGR